MCRFGGLMEEMQLQVLIKSNERGEVEEKTITGEQLKLT